MASEIWQFLMLAVGFFVVALGPGGQPARKQITTGFTVATRGNLDEPGVKEYLYKAEC